MLSMSFYIFHVFILIIYKYVQYVSRNRDFNQLTKLYIIAK